MLNEDYDVWVTNYRGSSYSTGHTHLDSEKDEEYWNFSMIDKGYDQKTTIQFIQNISHVEKVAYAGYSQGNTIMFHALSKDIEETFFAHNMSVMIAMAPCIMAKVPSFTG